MMRLVSVLFLTALTAASAWAKSAPTWHTREETAAVRERCVTDDWAIAQREKAVGNAVRWVAMSDQELWDFILDADIPRALNVAFGVGSPEVGKDVFREGGHYPWIMSTDLPFKVKCPVTGKIYPTNDFEAYLKGGRKEELDTTQPYVDDGTGYVAPDGQRYWFVAHYIFWQRWRRDVFSAMDALSHAYLLTGDPQYAHKLGVMLGRLVQVYPKMDYASQAYHNGQWPAKIHGRILDYIWENGTITRFARAYDSVYDAIGSDDTLASFLSERGIDDLKQAFEQDVLHFMARDVMEGRIRGNMYYQPTLATLAIIIDNDDPAYGPTTDEMVDWLVHGGGEIELILYSGFDRNGAGGESAPGYSAAWNVNFCKVADLLTRLGYDVTANPKWRQLVRFPYNLTIAGDFCTRIADCHGTIHGAPKLVDAVTNTFGYKHFEDPLCAQLLLELNQFPESLWGDSLDKADVERVAALAPDQRYLGTRDMGGYGLTVFDAGDGPTRRAATMYYGGPNAWHGHYDRLTLGYTAHGRDFLPEMGYPSHWNDKGERFTRGMPCHYIVEVDTKRPPDKRSGYLEFFAAGERVRVARAHANSWYGGPVSLYQRTFAMLDTGDESILIDLFRVEGGQQHDYHFHGLPFGEFSTEGLELTSTQESGTLLGPDVEWGGDTGPEDLSGYDFLRTVRRYKASDVWRARWVGREECRLDWWMPPYPEVIVCDGEPPSKPDYPETMEFLVVRNTGGESRLPAVIAPSRGADLVTAADFTDAGDQMQYHVETPQGTWQVAIADGGAFSATLTGPGEAKYGFFANHDVVDFAGMHLEVVGPTRFTIDSVDYASNSVTLAEPIPAPDLLVGEVVVISGNEFSASYTVAEAEERELRFEGPAITGMLELDDVSGAVVTSRTRVSGYGTQVAARAFHRMTLVSEDLTESAPIVGYSTPEDGAPTYTLARSVAFPDADEDGRRLAHFADYAPGYTVTVTPWIEVQLPARGAAPVCANVPIK
ncbi:MAG: hypothetical protein GY851_04325 [bacterium]|nr:hypothetical protein [bacterium]